MGGEGQVSQARVSSSQGIGVGWDKLPRLMFKISRGIFNNKLNGYTSNGF